MKILTDIRKNKINIFCAFIKTAKEHNIFNVEEQSLYDDLDILRRLRNRIHIQNERNEFERDEDHAFSIDRKILAEKTLEKIMRLMSRKHNRGMKAVDHFILPWSAHYASR